jgi:uncharacterized protein YdeI (YjbR/CyaY-like superfamily)
MGTPKFFQSASEFRAWLMTNSTSAKELLVGYFKVGSGNPCMSWSDSVDEALCYGWIDGVRKRIDDDTYSIRFTPRKTTSIWSAVNIAKFKKLMSEGRVQAGGVAAFARLDASKSLVYAYEQAQTAELSPAEIRAFKDKEKAWRFFELTPPSYKKVTLHWITSAKRSETRASRLAQLIDACACGRRLN